MFEGTLPLGRLIHWVVFPQGLGRQREVTFITSLFALQCTKSFLKWVYLQRKEFAPKEQIISIKCWTLLTRLFTFYRVSSLSSVFISRNTDSISHYKIVISSMPMYCHYRSRSTYKSDNHCSPDVNAYDLRTSSTYTCSHVNEFG